MVDYKVQLFINGKWVEGQKLEALPIINPSTEQQIGLVSKATIKDLDFALLAAQAGFDVWSSMSVIERSRILRRAAESLRNNADAIAHQMVLEQGKPLFESKFELEISAETLEWFAEEGRRTYGRMIPARRIGIQQYVIKEAIGPVAAFTPWNLPVSQAVRKIAAALAAGCSIILKGPEDTPIACASTVKCIADAGLPPGVLNLVYGVPAEISEYLIPHPVIRKISFTGSTFVGKHLASLAGQHMKRVTMELGGHAPAVVFDDADIGQAVNVLCGLKFRNAGQSCISPTRFLIQDGIYDIFLERFVSAASKIKVGDGLEPGVEMGPLANIRRLDSLDKIVKDAIEKGGQLLLGGQRIGNRGFFFAPTIIANAIPSMVGMNEEPFGPIAFFKRFTTTDQAIKESNRLDYGLASYIFSTTAKTCHRMSVELKSGMIGINHFGLGFSETPFGGIKDSGHGSEGGSEAMEAHMNIKFVSHLAC
jgi:succinate-semialdehyde dehydrogenase/glutarate-semialdehyde dehydrogenase